MRDIRNDTGILSETINGIGGAARTMTFAFTAPMVALGTYAVQAASGFDAAMRNINSILQLNEGGFASLQDQVMSFAKTTRAGVVPATQALYEVFSAGITDQARAMAVWETSNKVAEAGLADLGQTTNAITATMSAFNLETGQATHVGNIWTQMVKQGVGSLGDFLSNSQKILPLSAAMNIRLEDMGATLAFLSQGGGGAAKAETSYAMMLSNMMKPTTAMTRALGQLGVATGSQLVAKFGSVSAAVMALKKVTDETTFNKMFSKTGLEAALRITGNIEGMTKATKDFNQGLGTATMDAWAQQAKSFAFQWDLMRTSLEAVAVTIGQAIMPLITPLIQGFSQFLQGITKTNPKIMELSVIFISVVAAAAPLVWVLTSLLNPIGLIIAGVVALSAAFATNFDGIRSKVMKVVGDVVGNLQPLKDAVGTFMSTLFPDQHALDTAGGAKPVLNVLDHITVTKPSSLWDIYKKQGYDKQFSWPEFMKAARAGGWAGGVVNVNDMITLTGGKEAGNAQGEALGKGIAQGFARVDKIDEAAIIPPTIWDRLAAAITAALPKVKVALAGMWDGIKGWIVKTGIPLLDGIGGDILNSVAGWFKPKSDMGNSQVYAALTGAMTTDVGGAAKDAADNFSKLFPDLTAGLGALFSNVANWIEQEGVPTIARSIGFLAGRIASLLREGIGLMWQKVGGASGAGQVAGQAKTTLDMMVFKPLSEGVQEGVGKNDGNIFGTFMDNLGAALLLAAGAWVLAPTVIGAIAKPVIVAVTSALSSAIASSALGTGITTFVTGLGMAMTTALGALSIVGIGAIIIAALLSNQDVANGLKAWGDVFTNAGILISAWADQVGVKLRGAKRDLEIFLSDITLKIQAAKLVLNPNDQAAWDAGQLAGNTLLGDQIAKGMEEGISAYLMGAPLPVSVDGAVPYLTGTAANPQASKALIDSITNPQNLFTALDQAVNTSDTSAMQVLVPVAISYEASQNPNYGINMQMQQLMKDTGLDATTIAGFMTTYYRDDPVKVQEIEVSLQKLIVKPGVDTKVDTSAIVGGAGTSGSGWINRAIGNDTTGKSVGTVEVPVNAQPVITSTADASKAWADSIVKNLPADVMASVTANSGNMTASAASLTQPFVTAFDTTFGVAGSVTIAWHTFLTTFVTDTGTLQVTAETKFPLVQAAGVKAFDAIMNSASVADDKIKKIQGSLAALVGASPYEIVVNIKTNGSMPTLPAGATGADGSHAVGLGTVPFDGYQAILHQGEMVLNKGAADEYRSRGALPAQKQNIEVDQSSPTFIVNGVQDFDKFLREAKRRGYNLDKYRR